MDASKLCGRKKEGGGKCRKPRMKAAETCESHSGLPPTEAQQKASRENSTRRLLGEGIRNEAEGQLVEDYLRGGLGPADILRSVEVQMLLRLHRAAAIEATGGFDPLVRRVLLDAKEHLGPKGEGEAQPRPMEEWEFLQKVEDAVAKHPEAMLARILRDFPPGTAQQVRDLLRKPGEVSDAAA